MLWWATWDGVNCFRRYRSLPAEYRQPARRRLLESAGLLTASTVSDKAIQDIVKAYARLQRGYQTAKNHAQLSLTAALLPPLVLKAAQTYADGKNLSQTTVSALQTAQCFPVAQLPFPYNSCKDSHAQQGGCTSGSGTMHYAVVSLAESADYAHYRLVGGVLPVIHASASNTALLRQQLNLPASPHHEHILQRLVGITGPNGVARSIVANISAAQKATTQTDLNEAYKLVVKYASSGGGPAEAVVSQLRDATWVHVNGGTFVQVSQLCCDLGGQDADGGEGLMVLNRHASMLAGAWGHEQAQVQQKKTAGMHMPHHDNTLVQRSHIAAS